MTTHSVHVTGYDDGPTLAFRCTAEPGDPCHLLHLDGHGQVVDPPTDVGYCIVAEWWDETGGDTISPDHPLPGPPPWPVEVRWENGGEYPVLLPPSDAEAEPTRILLGDFETEAYRWRMERWPIPDTAEEIALALKCCEEVGEVAGAVAKRVTGDATLQDLADELGDVLITLSILAGRHGWTLGDLRHRRFQEVRER